MKRRVAVVSLILTVVLLMTAGGCGKTQEKTPADATQKAGPQQQAGSTRFMSLASGGTGGVYYPLGAGIAKIIGKYCPGTNVTAEATGASVENIKLIGSGQVQMGMVFANVAYEAITGTGSFDKKYDIKVLFGMYPTPVHIMVPAESTIKSVADLKGKRVAVGSPGSGNEVIAKSILKAYGLTYNDLKAEYLSVAETCNGIKDGVVDCGFSCTAYPTSSVMDLATTRRIRMLNIEDDKMEQILKENPFFFKTEIPGNVYRNVPDKTITVGFGNLMVCSSAMSEKDAYDIVKAVFDHLPELEATHSVAKQMNLELGCTSPGVPLHPGAIKYFKEKGVLK